VKDRANRITSCAHFRQAIRHYQRSAKERGKIIVTISLRLHATDFRQAIGESEGKKILLHAADFLQAKLRQSEISEKKGQKYCYNSEREGKQYHFMPQIRDSLKKFCLL
jgi:hypothetical protein